jgi:hypothetical protein
LSGKLIVRKGENEKLIMDFPAGDPKEWSFDENVIRYFED